MNKPIAALALCALAAGCARAPERIPAAYISPTNYQSLDCPQLAQEGARIDGALAVASIQQRQARRGDTWGVLLIGLPVASISGENIAPEIARYKGEQAAVRQVSTAKNCGP
jgi:hypothetical protein